MLFRKSILFLSLVLSSMATSCTTRYQDMLRERDATIRELSGHVARLRGENDELQRRSVAPAPTEAAAPKTESPSLLNDINKDLEGGAEARYVRGRISIGVDDTVTFDSGSTALKDSSHKVLRSVANALKNRFGGKRIYVEGHTDSDPLVKTKDKYQDNMHLSSLRAHAVVRYLVQQGVPESSLVVVGFGQHDPRDPKSKARNRRVEIVVGENM